MTNAIRTCTIAVAILMMPVTAVGQRSADPSHIEARLSTLQQQLTDISARIEQLKAQDQQLQHRSESMRTTLEARLQQLEEGATGRGRRR